MSVPTVLVTGCAGYIGSMLVGALLRSHCRVIGVDSLIYDNAASLLNYFGDPNFEFVREDVQHTLAIQKLASKADIIIPLAALVGAPLCEKLPHTAVEVNSHAIKELMKGLSKDQRVIFTNTNSGYGETDGTRFCTEEDKINPISVYGVTKCFGEAHILSHPNSVSLRLATVFGASPRMRMDLMVNDFTAKLYRDRKIEVFDPDFKRNFVHVRDVVSAIQFMITRYYQTGIFNLGLPSANLTKMELALTIADFLKVPYCNVTIGTGSDPDRRNYLVSNKKILSSGFKFSHSLEDGIREVSLVCQTHSSSQLAEMRNVK
jgi:nucleoside-diphosphate-sugar epimerase